VRRGRKAADLLREDGRAAEGQNIGSLGFFLFLNVIEMKNRKLYVTQAYLMMITVVAVSLLIGTSSCAQQGARESPRVIGGPCQYKSYEGFAKITSITRTEAPGRHGDERYEVRFHFFPDQKIEETFVQTEGKEFLLLDNLLLPRREFLEDHDIKVGKELECVMEVIQKGTCTPVLFKFPSLRSNDSSKR
jgi:hypothetical protein